MDQTAVSPTFVGRRQEHIEFVSTVSLSLENADISDEAGICLYRENTSHYDFFVRQEEGRAQSIVLRFRLGSMSHIEKVVPLKSKALLLRIRANREYYFFDYSTDGGHFWHCAGQMNCRYLSSETVGGFTGVVIGLYASAASENSKAYGEFKWLDYE